MRRRGTAEQHQHRFRCEQYLFVQIMIQVGLRSLGRRATLTMMMSLVRTGFRRGLVFFVDDVIVTVPLGDCGN